MAVLDRAPDLDRLRERERPDDGVLGFGVTAEEDSTPDLQSVPDAIRTELDELDELVALASG